MDGSDDEVFPPEEDMEVREELSGSETAGEGSEFDVKGDIKADEEGRSVIERLLKALGKKGTDIVAQRISECEEAEEKRALLALLTRMPATDTVKSLMSNMAKEKVEDKESGIDSESAGEIGPGGSSGDSDKSP